MMEQRDHDSLIRLEAEIGQVKEAVLEIREMVKAQNGRVGKIESWKAQVTGGLVVVGALGLGSILTTVITLAARGH